MHQSFETPASPPLGHERGIHFFGKWKQVKSPAPGRKVNGELPRPFIFLQKTCYSQDCQAQQMWNEHNWYQSS